MPRQAFEFPDIEQLLSDWLAPRLELEVGTAVPGGTTFVKILRTGGTQQTKVSDNPLVTIEAYHPRESGALALAEKTRGLVMYQLPGTIVDGVVVYGVAHGGGPVNLPDPKHKSKRYSFTVAVHLRGSLT